MAYRKKRFSRKRKYRRKVKSSKKKYSKAKKTKYVGKKPTMSKAFFRHFNAAMNASSPHGHSIQLDATSLSFPINKQASLSINWKTLDQIQAAGNKLFPNSVPSVGINQNFNLIVEHTSQHKTFRNGTQITMYVDCYMCTPKSPVATNDDDFITNWSNIMTETGVGAIDINQVGVTPMDATGLKKKWNYKRLWTKQIVPGQTFTEIIADSSTRTVQYTNSVVDEGAAQDFAIFKKNLSIQYVYIARGVPVIGGSGLTFRRANSSSYTASVPAADAQGLEVSIETRYKIRCPAPIQTTNKTTYAVGLIDNLGTWVPTTPYPVVELNNPVTVVTGQP